MAIVHGEEHSPQSPTPGRCVEHHSRRRVPSHEGPVRLETGSNSVPSDQPKAGTSGGGYVCQQTDSPAADISQLETRSDGHGHGRVHSGLGRAQSICQASVQPDRQSTGTDSPTAS